MRVFGANSPDPDDNKRGAHGPNASKPYARMMKALSQAATKKKLAPHN